MDNFIFCKWAPNNGEENIKSKKKDKHIAIGNNVMETILQEGPEFINKHNITEDRKENKKEQFVKLNDREMMIQKNLNPFLSSNYLEDLNVQEQFLTPKNSNMEE